MGRYLTVAQIVKQTAINLGLPTVDDPVSSTDPLQVQLVGLLTEAGRDIVLKHEWPQLVAEEIVTTVAGQVDYTLPSDFLHIIPQSGWNRTTRFPLGGPLSVQEWQYLKAAVVGVTFNVLFRVTPTLMRLFPTPPVGFTIAYEYQSRNWLSKAGTTPATVNLTSSLQRSFASVEDSILYFPVDFSSDLSPYLGDSCSVEIGIAAPVFSATVDDESGIGNNINHSGAYMLALNGFDPGSMDSYDQSDFTAIVAAGTEGEEHLTGQFGLPNSGTYAPTNYWLSCNNQLQFDHQPGESVSIQFGGNQETLTGIATLKVDGSYVYPVIELQGSASYDHAEGESASIVVTTGATAAPNGSPELDAPESSGDLVLLEPILMMKALKLRFLQTKGFDTTIQQKEYDDTLIMLAGRSDGAPRLSLNGNRIRDRFLDGLNIPITGMGGQGFGG
jgi:hypothetical protein